MTDQTKLTIADTIAQNLTEQIIQGTLPPDAKLRQDHIAKSFDTSHVPVREALLQLEARGLVVSLPRRGVQVAPLAASDLREILEMRLALEPVALRHSIPNLTAAQRQTAESARIDCDEAADIQTWERQNRRFHHAILAGCDMPRMLAEIDDLQALAARHLLANWSRKWKPRQDRDHQAIMQAVDQRNVPLAVSTLQRHLTRFA
jgi:DNA-binding GntR family transcriptional regulator